MKNYGQVPETKHLPEISFIGWMKMKCSKSHRESFNHTVFQSGREFDRVFIISFSARYGLSIRYFCVG